MGSDYEKRKADDEARIAAFAKYGVPQGAIPADAYNKIQSGQMTWDQYLSGWDPNNVTTRIQSTGTTGGPGGSATFTTAPGTVGSTIGGGYASGGGSSGGGSGGSGNSAMADAALRRIEQVGTGADVPYNAAQTDRMMSAQTDMSAAAEAQQQAALRRTVGAGGGSLYDPSTGAAQQELTANRQAANQGARRDIDTTAQDRNFEAQFAANRLLAAQSDGGTNSGNPYGQNGRYGTQGSQEDGDTDQRRSQEDGDTDQRRSPEYGDTDPRRGGNIRSYGGYNLAPNKLNNTATAQYATAAALKRIPTEDGVQSYR